MFVCFLGQINIFGIVDFFICEFFKVFCNIVYGVFSVSNVVWSQNKGIVVFVEINIIGLVVIIIDILVMDVVSM